MFSFWSARYAILYCREQYSIECSISSGLQYEVGGVLQLWKVVLCRPNWYHRGMHTTIRSSVCTNHIIHLLSHLEEDSLIFYLRAFLPSSDNNDNRRKTQTLPRHDRGWTYLTFIEASVSLAPSGIRLGLIVLHKAAGPCPELIKPQNRWFWGEFRKRLLRWRRHNLSRRVFFFLKAQLGRLLNVGFSG